MDTRFIDEMKSYMQNERRQVEVDGLPPFYVGPLTVAQASAIEQESDNMLKLARHFQVRAVDENGKLLVKGGLEFDKFVREADLEKITQAVIAMSEGDNTLEESEKN